jgi:hypothetical protein
MHGSRDGTLIDKAARAIVAEEVGLPSYFGLSNMVLRKGATIW